MNISPTGHGLPDVIFEDMVKIHNLTLGKYPIRVIESDNMPDNMLTVVRERAAERLIAIDEFIDKWKSEFEPEFTQDELRQIYYQGEVPC